VVFKKTGTNLKTAYELCFIPYWPNLMSSFGKILGAFFKIIRYRRTYIRTDGTDTIGHFGFQPAAKKACRSCARMLVLVGACLQSFTVFAQSSLAIRFLNKQVYMKRSTQPQNGGGAKIFSKCFKKKSIRDL
jgi:hypothetical protein